MSDEKPDQKPENTNLDAAAEASATNLPKAYDPSIIEQRWAEYWVRERLFEVPTPKSSGAPSMQGMGGKNDANFTMLLPPPNVTGGLRSGPTRRRQPSSS